MEKKEASDPNIRKIIGKYMILELLGKGQYGTVYLGKNRSTKEVLAIKMIDRATLSERLLNNLVREIEVMREVKHYSIIKLLDIQATKNRFYLIFELCNCGDLENYRTLRPNNRLSQSEARYIIRQVADGLHELHKKNILHRDVKLANIFLHDPSIPSLRNVFKMPQKGPQYLGEHVKNLRESGIMVRIGDLGFSRSLEAGTLAQTLCGTPVNMAPEVLNGQQYNGEADIWSLGTILFELLTGYSPFTGTSKQDLKGNLKKGGFAIPKRLKLSLNCVHFLNSCLQYDPDKRISFDELMQHTFLKLEPQRDQDGNIIAHQSEEVQQMLTMSMSDLHGAYVANQLLESFEQKALGPYKFLNEKNAIVLNAKEMSKINDLYEQKFIQAQTAIQDYYEGLKPKEKQEVPEEDSHSGEDSHYQSEEEQKQPDGDKDDQQPKEEEIKQQNVEKNSEEVRPSTPAHSENENQKLKRSTDFERVSKTELESMEKEEEEKKEILPEYKEPKHEGCDYLVKTGMEEGVKEGETGYRVDEIKVFEGYFQFEFAAA